MGGAERESDSNLLFHLLVRSLVDSCMCPDQGGTCNLNTSEGH